MAEAAMQGANCSSGAKNKNSPSAFLLFYVSQLT